ncbi:MAG: hypothetical protein RLZZ156_1406 [Deinococcota bacterium]|jgi:hypothetical protein
MSLAHLYKLPIAVWEAQNSLLTTTSEALAQSQLEGVLEYEWHDHMTAETVGAVFALFDLDGQVNEATGLDVISPKTIKRFAADFTERCTNTQLSTLANCAERVGKIMHSLLKELERAADSELTDRIDHIQTYVSDEEMALTYPDRLN